tara:strand:+ start:381 stop:1601 length:1221 start_codon:yes stop_codon:yes gene_type:complete
MGKSKKNEPRKLANKKMIYSNLIIQPNAWNKLNNYFHNKKLPNALLFYGNNGLGKEGHAIEFAALINCLQPENKKSCGKCMSCQKIKTFQHGNVKLIHPLPTGKQNSAKSPLENLTKSELENYQDMLSLKSTNPYYKIEVPKSNSILINSIRSLKKDLSLSKIEKGWNIIIILEAEKLCYPSNVAANALLKILEEPPEKTLFILITSNYSKIIDTVKSRCQSIFFPKIAYSKLYDLMDDNLSYEEKSIIANITDGDINLIKNLDNSITEIYDDLKMFIKSCYSSRHEYNDLIIQRISILKRTDNIKLLIFFRIIMIYFKDLFVFAESKDIKYIVYKNLDKHYNKIINHYNHSNWNLCIDIIENTLNNIYKNASIPLCINGMIIEIQELINGNKNEKFDINNWLETK